MSRLWGGQPGRPWLAAAFLLGLGVSVPGPARAEPEVFSEISGFAGLELRAFEAGGVFPGQDDDFVGALVLEPEYFRERTPSDPDAPVDRFVARPFLRLDSADDERTHLDVRELYWQRVGDGWELDVGVRHVFWGVTESAHLVDVINQTDLVEDPDGEDKLGQPMVRLGLSRDWGQLELFVLPGFRERTFPGEDGRLRSETAVDTGRARFASSAEDGHVDLAVRFSRVLGDMDLGVSWFRGTEREPLFLLEPRPDGVVPVPFYAQASRIAVDLQATLGSWLWKLEAVQRWGRSSGSPSGESREPFFEDHAAAVFGFEHTLFDVRGSGLDVGLLAEYLWDERGEHATTPFEDDLFLGSRLAWNDTQSTELLVGGTVDLETGAFLATVEGSRRLGERFEIELRARLFGGFDEKGAEADDPLRAFERDDYLQLALKRYF